MNVATMEKQQEDNSQMGMVLQVAATDQCSPLNPHDWFFSDTTETGRSHTSALWWQHVHMGNSETDLHVWYQDEIHISNVRLHAGASPGILLVHNNVCPPLARMKAVPGWWRHWRQLWRFSGKLCTGPSKPTKQCHTVQKFTGALIQVQNKI